MRTTPSQLIPENARKVVKSALVLHNFVKFLDGSYCTPDYVDLFEDNEIVSGSWRNEVSTLLRNHSRKTNNNATEDAFILRDKMKDFIKSH